MGNISRAGSAESAYLEDEPRTPATHRKRKADADGDSRSSQKRAPVSRGAQRKYRVDPRTPIMVDFYVSFPALSNTPCLLMMPVSRCAPKHNFRAVHVLVASLLTHDAEA